MQRKSNNHFYFFLVNIPGNSETIQEAERDPSSQVSTLKRKYSTPAQDELKNQVEALKSELVLLHAIKDSSHASGNEKKKIGSLTKELESAEKKLNSKILHAKHAKISRNKMKQNKIVEPETEATTSETTISSTSATTNKGPGRPSLETEQPELLKTITEIAMFGASADERRRCEITRTCRTLDDLLEKLIQLGYKISRSGLYLRIIPRKSNSIEGKKHVTTAPVKLRRPEADHHKAHPDQFFCRASIRNLEILTSILGPIEVCFISQDDKARVPIGMTAANKQSPLLMHVQYKVSLPDHDFVIANQHRLIPSVYAGCNIKTDSMGKPDAVSYSGPTYISIRSGKHSSSTASSHASDFDRLANLDCFKKIMYNDSNCMKPVMIISADGGPDENPRYPKVINNAIKHFREYDLDVFIVVTNAPGRSAFNRVERRMAPLSLHLAGVVLPHDSYGTHLDQSGRTINPELEKENFQKAGQVLAEIWSKVKIDQETVVAEYIVPNPVKEKFVPSAPSQEWYSQHVRESQYMLQVRKNPSNWYQIMIENLLC